MSQGTVVSLFAGIGGFDLALSRLGYETVAYSEIDPLACDVMAARFPAAVNLGDITTIEWSQVETPTILCGGFPCQDISVAGKGAGLAGARSGLWYEFARAIRHLRPRLVLVENVGALLVRGIDAVLGTLAEVGYNASWTVLSAADVGAPHRRERVWIVAELADGAGDGWDAGRCDILTAGSGSTRGSGHALADGPRDGGHTVNLEDQIERSTGKLNPDWVETLMGYPIGWTDPAVPNEALVWAPFPAPPGPQYEWEPPRVTTRKDGRRKRLRCLGNSIVPACLTAALAELVEVASTSGPCSSGSSGSGRSAGRRARGAR